MKCKEIKDYLKISRATFYRYVHNKKIPAFKVGGRWRADKASLEKWLKKQERERMK